MIWSSLLTSLRDDEAPNLPPHVSVSSLPIRQLRDIVLGGLRRKKFWEKVTDTVHPFHVDELHLSETSPYDADPMGRMAMKLLAGGQQVLVEKGSSIQLWSVEPKECLWTTPPFTENHVCLSFDFEVAEGGKHLMVAALFLESEVYRRSVSSILCC